MGSWAVDYEKLMLISVTQNHDILETSTSSLLFSSVTQAGEEVAAGNSTPGECFITSSELIFNQDSTSPQVLPPTLSELVSESAPSSALRMVGTDPNLLERLLGTFQMESSGSSPRRSLSKIHQWRKREPRHTQSTFDYRLMSQGGGPQHLSQTLEQ